MSLYTQILNYKPDFNSQFQCVLEPNHKHIVFKNFDKQCKENNKIYRRSKPIDKITKYNILDPRQLVDDSTNPPDYNIQIELFPPKTEKLMENKKDFNKHYIQQNMGYINDESFLFNINHKNDKGKTFNINNNIIEHDKSSDIDMLFSETVSKGGINERTSRRMIIDDVTKEDQKWCEGGLYKNDDFKETEEPKAYNLY
tara:strand:- start:92 stop:688 length:597 start_codon:yes stop_codon:yes gene_type:complete